MAFGDTWLISVMMRFTSNGASVMREMATATRTANAAVDQHTAKVRAAEAAMQRYRTTALRFGTEVAAGFAAAGSAAIAFGVEGAAQIQRALTSTAIALRIPAQGSQFDQLTRSVFQVSGSTAQDALTIAKEMAAATTAGLNNQKDMLDAFPRIARAADVLWMSPKHIAPVEAVTQMSTLAHLFGTYRGPAFQHMLDRATEMMYVQPEGLKSLITQGRMFIGPALSRGVSEEDIFRQSMLMGQTGYLRSRGGSGLARVIEYLGGAETVTGHLSRAQRGAMERLGLLGPGGTLSKQFIGAHGTMLLQKIVDHLEALRQQAQKRGTSMGFANDITNAFLAQGGRYMLTGLLPAVYAKAKENWRVMNELGGVDKMWSQYTHNFIYQFSVFVTNFQNIFKAMFVPLLPKFTDWFQSMGETLGKFVQYLAEHKNDAKVLGELVVAFTALSGLRALVGVVQLARLPLAVRGMQMALNSLTETITRDTAVIAGDSMVAGGGGAAARWRALGAGGAGVSAFAREAAEAEKAAMAATRLSRTLNILGGILDVASVAVFGVNASIAALIAGITSVAGLLWGGFHLAKHDPQAFQVAMSGDLNRGSPQQVEQDLYAMNTEHLAGQLANTINIHLAPGTPRQMADDFLNQVQRLRSTTRSQGTTRSNPHSPPLLGISPLLLPAQ